MVFRNRDEAGEVLAKSLVEYADRDDVVVLGIPRGGVPVAYEVAMRLGAPLDIFVVGHITAPGHPDLVVGSVASGGMLVLDEGLVGDLELDEGLLATRIQEEAARVAEREVILREGRSAAEVEGRTVIVIDDGVSTDLTLSASIAALRQRRAGRIVAAAPVASAVACERLRQRADVLVCPLTPDPFTSVSTWYRDYSQVTDEELQQLLSSAAALSEITFSPP